MCKFIMLPQPYDMAFKSVIFIAPVISPPPVSISISVLFIYKILSAGLVGTSSNVLEHCRRHDTGTQTTPNEA